MQEPSYKERADHVLRKRVVILIWFGLSMAAMAWLLFKHFRGPAVEYVWFAVPGLVFIGLLPVVVMWRCLDCGSFLGLNPFPKRCPTCLRRFTPDVAILDVQDPAARPGKDKPDPMKPVAAPVKKKAGAGPKVKSKKKSKKKRGVKGRK